jgi:hypothetical protein
MRGVRHALLRAQAEGGGLPLHAVRGSIPSWGQAT